MPTNQEFNQALQRVVTYVDRIDDETVEQLEAQTDSGQPISGYFCRHGNHVYQVMGCPVWEYFNIRYNFNLAQLVATQRTTGSAPGEVEEVELAEEDVQVAVDELAERLTRDEHQSLRLELVRGISRPNMAAELMTHDNSGVFGFNIDSKQYLYEDRYSLGDFGKAVQSVVSIGWLGKETLLEGYDIREELAFVEEEPAAELDDGPTAFQ